MELIVDFSFIIPVLSLLALAYVNLSDDGKRRRGELENEWW